MESECTTICAQLHASPQPAIAHPTALNSGSTARIFSCTTSHSSHSDTCERCTAVNLRAHLRCACCVRAVVLPTRSYLRVYMNHLQLINCVAYYCTVLYTLGLVLSPSVSENPPATHLILLAPQVWYSIVPPHLCVHCTLPLNLPHEILCIIRENS